MLFELLELKEFRAFIVSTRYEIQKHIQDKSESAECQHGLMVQPKCWIK